VKTIGLPADLPASLDAIHVKVREAFARRDLPAYARHVDSEVDYRDAKGRRLTRDELLSSVSGQLERLTRFTSSFTRESLTVVDGDAVEVGSQHATIALRIWLLLELRWTVRRHGTFTWRRDRADGWVLRRVDLDDEEVRRAGVGVRRVW
jgi:hypothetical protein